MNTYEAFEALMLICFSVSWYWSIYRMLRERAIVGKSAMFVALICMGYVFGVISKVAAWQDTGQLSPLIWLYTWNLVVTVTDLVLVLHFRRAGAHVRVIP